MPGNPSDLKALLIVAIILFIVGNMYGQETWTVRNPPSRQSLFDLTWGQGMYVAVGEKGTIQTSPDALKWSFQNAQTELNLNSIIFGDNVFVAVGDSGIIITSRDGVNWERLVSNTSQKIYSVTYGNGTYIAGLDDSLLCSSDGSTWSISSGGCGYVACGNGRFICSGNSSKRKSGSYSTDGRSWDTVPGVGNLAKITWTNSQFIQISGSWYSSDFGAFLSAGSSSSTDGISWIYKASSGLVSIPKQVIYANDSYLAIAEGGGIYTSPNCSTWTKQSSGILQNLNAVMWHDNHYVVVGDIRKILTSSDGEKWTNMGSLYSSGHYSNLNGVVSSSHTAIIVGSNGTLLKSSELATWSCISDTGSPSYTAVAVQNEFFVAAGYFIKLLTWPAFVLRYYSFAQMNNETEWTFQSSAGSCVPTSMVWTDTQFIVVGQSGMLTSSNGYTWKWQPSPQCSTDVLYDIATGPIINDSRQVVAVGAVSGATIADGVIINSPNSTNWNRTIFGTVPLNAVCWGNSQWVVLQDGKTILTSPDGTTWKSRSTGSPFYLYDITWGPRGFVAIGDSGTILSSSDANTWSVQNSGITQRLKNVTWGHGHYIAVGDSGIVLTSPAPASVQRTEQAFSKKSSLSLLGTSITYSIPYSSIVRLKVFDLQGRCNAVIEKTYQEAGDYTAELPKQIGIGSYIISLRADDIKMDRKIFFQR